MNAFNSLFTVAGEYEFALLAQPIDAVLVATVKMWGVAWEAAG
jgi:hypothetical protein